MASRTVTRHYADRTTATFARSKQGRRSLPPGEAKVKFSARIHPLTEAHVLEQARRYGMSASAYADLALAAYEISSDNNC